MDHLAILDKKRDLLSKIISGEKTIESRWYKHRKTPYGKINPGDVVYFKDSSEPVTAKALVDSVLFFDQLNEHKIKEILLKYGEKICVPLSYAEKLYGKNICTLIFLKNVRKIEPFQVSKKGFGTMAAWITIEDIEHIKI